MLWKNSKKTILASASASLPRKFQDFSGPNSFSRTFQVLKILQTQSQDFPGPGNFINTIPGLSRSWKFYKYNPRTFHEARRTLHFRMQYWKRHCPDGGEMVCPCTFWPHPVSVWPRWPRWVWLPAWHFLLVFCSNHSHKMHCFWAKSIKQRNGQMDHSTAQCPHGWEGIVTQKSSRASYT